MMWFRSMGRPRAETLVVAVNAAFDPDDRFIILASQRLIAEQDGFGKNPLICAIVPGPVVQAGRCPVPQARLCLP